VLGEDFKADVLLKLQQACSYVKRMGNFGEMHMWSNMYNQDHLLWGCAVVASRSTPGVFALLQPYGRRNVRVLPRVFPSSPGCIS
jgi:hypothetical protein